MGLDFDLLVANKIIRKRIASPMGAALLVSIAVSPIFGSAPAGIPRQLARERANQVSDVRYRLDYKLAPHANDTSGHEELGFRLKTVDWLLIDFREGTASNLWVNGTPLPVNAENGHIALPASETKMTVANISTLCLFPWTQAWLSHASTSPISKRASRLP